MHTVLPADNSQHLLTKPPGQYQVIERIFSWQIVPVPAETKTETQVTWFAPLIPEDRRLANFPSNADGDVEITD